MLVDRTHLRWAMATAAALVAAASGYWLSVARAGEASGGSVAGLIFGILSLAAMTVAGLLAVRKKFPVARWGSAQFWMRAHIWLGLLSLPLACFHSGFRFGGALESAFMMLLLAVVVSGIYGLALQQVLPRLLKVRVPLETFPQQIPFLCQQFRDEGERLLKELEGPAKKAGPASAVKSAPATAAVTETPSDGAAATSAPPAVKAPVAADKAMAAAKVLAAKAAASAKLPAASVGGDSKSATAGEGAGVAAEILPAKAAAGAQTAPEPAAPSGPLAAAKAAAAKAAAAKAAAIAAKPAPAAATMEADDGPLPRFELLARFYRDEVLPFLGSDSRIASRQHLASESYARMAFANLAASLPARALAAIHRLDEMVAERRQFLVQVRIQSWLRSWLLVHVPLSAALFVLAAVHVVTALRVVPWS